jgi:hypothetical protein
VRPHVQLTLHWCIDAAIIAALIAIYQHVTFRFLLIAIAVPYGIYEANWLKGVYAVAPTPKDFVAQRPFWKTLGIYYGVFVCLLAFVMLTVGQDLARYLGEHSMQLAVFLIALLTPLAVFIVVHQAAVFRALRAGEA